MALGRSTQIALQLSGKHQLQAYADDVNLLRDNILVDTIKQNTETLIDASIGVCLEINTQNTKKMLLLFH
jgi:hypothetical protein